MPGKGGKDVRAGGAFFELWAKDGLTAVLSGVKSRVKAFVGFMSSVGNASAIAGAGLAAPLVALFKGGVDRAADAAKMSHQLGIPIELMSRLQYAAEQAGVSVDEVMKDTEGRYSKLINNAPGIDPARAKQALELQREMAAATDALRQAMLPLLTPVIKIAKGFGEFVQKNKEYLPTVAAVAVGLIGLGAAIKLLGVVFAAVAPIATLAWAAITGPVGLGVLLGATLGTGLFLLLANATDGLKGLENGFTDLASTAKSAWGGITAALAKGDLQGAWDVLVAGLNLGWAELTHSLTKGWINFKIFFLDGRDEIIDTTLAGFFKMGAEIAKSLSRALGPVFESFAGLAARLGLDDVADQLNRIGSLAKVTDEDWAKMTGAADNWVVKREEERNRIRARELIKNDAERDKAKADFDATVGKAKAPAAPAAPEADKLPPLAESLRAAVSVKGGFNAAALGQQFGLSDHAQKQTELQKQMVGHLGALPQKFADAVLKVLSFK